MLSRATAPAWIVRGWTRRRAANVGTLILALANAVISYDALSAAARDAGLPWVLSWLFPLATDGIIAVATPAQLELREQAAPWWVRAQIGFLLWAAIVFSVVGNASRAHDLWTGISVSVVPVPTWHAVWLALPPLAYAGALHVLGLVHRYPVSAGDDSADLRAELANARGELTAARRALARAHPQPASHGPALPEGRPESAANGAASTGRAAHGARRDQMRALLAEEPALTGAEIGARLGIDAGYARRLRAEIAAEMANGAAPDTASEEESA